MLYAVEFGEFAIQKMTAGFFFLKDQLTGRTGRSGGGGGADRQGYAPLYRTSVGDRTNGNGSGSPTGTSPGNDNSLLDDLEEDA